MSNIHLLCCTGSLAVVLSVWQRDRNLMDSYRVITVDVPEFTIVSDARDPWQSGVTSCVVMKNDEVLYHQMSTFCHESMQLRSLCQSERMRDSVQHKIWTYPYYRAVNTEHQQRWTRWWCMTSSKHLPKSDKWGRTVLKLRKCCTPVNKAMSEISNCRHFFLSNLCEFRWRPEGPVSQIHSPHLHTGDPGIFSDLLRSVQLLKRE